MTVLIEKSSKVWKGHMVKAAAGWAACFPIAALLLLATAGVNTAFHSSEPAAFISAFLVITMIVQWIVMPTYFIWAVAMRWWHHG